MEAERWRKVQEVFDQAVERQGDDRQAFLDAACGDDDTLRKEVEDMLQVDDTLGVDCLETVVMGGSALLTETFDPILRRGSIGKYKIIEKVGEGGFGMVHRGVDQDLKRDVAIKTCTSSDERLRLRFQREAEISARLQHPNITTVHDLGIEDGIPYLVQEFLIGEDLSDKIERQDSLDTSTRLDYLLQIARGLTHAHKHGVLHRDVKPGNMRVLHNGRLKILDFGIARLVDERNPITTEGVAVGTVGYLSPEQFEGTGVDQRSDIFSFGVVAYELLTQVRPFPGTTFSEVSYKLMYETPQPMGELWPDCPVTLEHLVNRCLEKDKHNRFQSFHELMPVLEEVIRQLADDEDGKTPLVTVGQEAERRHRNRWFIMAAGFLGLLALLVVTVFFGPTGEDPAAPGGLAPASGLDGAAAEQAAMSSPAEQTTGPPTAAPDAAPPMPENPSAAGPQDAGPQDAGPQVAGANAGTGDDAVLVSQAAAPAEGAVPGNSTAGDAAPTDAASTDAAPTDAAPTDLPGRAASEARADLLGTPPPTSTSVPAEAIAPSTGPVTSTGSTSEAPISTATHDGDPAADATAPNLSEDAANGPRIATVPDVPTTDELALGEASSGAQALPTETAQRLPVDVKPTLLRRGEAIYPQRAYRLKIEARVQIGVRVDERGNVIQTLVTSCMVQRSPKPRPCRPKEGFGDSALKAANKSKFRRGTRDGVPTPMWTELTYDFKYQ